MFEAGSLEKILAAAREVVENYLENQLIYEELNHYKKHGEILGKHPIFSRMHRLNEIRAMKTGELVTLKIRLTNNLVKNRRRYKDQPKHKASAKRLNRIETMKLELTEVNRLLNMDEKQVL